MNPLLKQEMAIFLSVEASLKAGAGVGAEVSLDLRVGVLPRTWYGASLGVLLDMGGWIIGLRRRIITVFRSWIYCWIQFIVVYQLRL